MRGHCIILHRVHGACSRGYRRGERGREAPRSRLEEESIKASAHIGCSVVLSVVLSRTAPLKGNPPPPFIVTRRDGVHAQGIVEVVVFPPNRGGAVVDGEFIAQRCTVVIPYYNTDMNDDL